MTDHRRKLSNANEMLAAIEEMAIHTSQGSFVRADDLKELLQRYEQEREQPHPAEVPRSFAHAKLLARGDAKLNESFPDRSVPQPPSRA